MTVSVDAPAKTPIQGLWCYPPESDDAPDYICDTVREGLTVTNVASAQRFFRELCRWRAASVRHLTDVVFLDHQTWQDRPHAFWPRATRG